MIETRIINNWLDQDLNKFLSHKFLYETPHYLNEYSVDPNKRFYSFDFDSKDLIINYLTFKLQTTLKLNLQFNRININIQHTNMNGEFHWDKESTFTCLYMLEGSGDFEIKNEKTFEFEKNKLICFDARKLHMGHGPKEGVRITLAFKTNIINMIKDNEGE